MNTEKNFYTHRFEKKAGLCIIDRARSANGEKFDIAMARNDFQAKIILDALNREQKLESLVKAYFSDDSDLDQPVCCGGGSTPDDLCGCMGATGRAMIEHEIKTLIEDPS